MEQRICAGYVITQSIQVKDTEFVLGEHPKTGMCATWQCKNGDNYFWGHYITNKYDALGDDVACTDSLFHYRSSFAL